MEISLAGWSINRRFRNQDDPLSLLDYPQLARDEFGINAVELNSPFFTYEDPNDPAQSGISDAYIDALRHRADDVGVRLLSIAVDGHGNLSALDEDERNQAVQNHKKWFDISQKLGCNAFRANSGGSRGADVSEEEIEQCIKSFKELATSGENTGIRVMMENHGGVSVSPDNINRVMEAVDSAYCRVLADFLNWRPMDDKVENLRAVAPFTWATHAKFLSFDENGESNEIDCKSVMDIFKTAGYINPFGIEYEGQTDDHEGVLKSKALIEKHGY